jgi:hypothetical protein
MNKQLAKSTVEFISVLLHSRTQAHIFHFQTRSFSQHKALEQYYTAIIPLLDSYTEAYQGNYGILTGYTNPIFTNDPNLSVRYFQELLKCVNKVIVPDKYLQNIIDNIHELVYKTLYMLKTLK